jgi:hypothetical protein
VTPDGRPEAIDFSRYIKDWSVKYGFSAQHAKEEIDKWIADIEANQNDRYKLGLAEFAKKNFGEASKLFNEAADYKTKQLAEIRRKKEEAEREEKAAVEDLVRTISLEGDAHYSNYTFDKALTPITALSSMYRGSRLRNYGQRPIWISVGPIGSSALELKGLPLHNILAPR